MTGQLKKRGLLGGILAAVAGFSAGVMGSGRAALAELPENAKFARPTQAVRGRAPGKKGCAGDKLARMAAEGRLGMRHGA